MTNQPRTGQDPQTGEQGQNTSVSGGPSLADTLRGAIPLGIAVVVGVFVALGIEGDVRSRLIRNRGEEVFLAITLVLLGVSLAILVSGVADARKAQKGSRLRGWGTVAGGLLILVGAIWAVRSGTEGIAEREQPDVSISAALQAADSPLVNLEVAGSALSLRSEERMLVRVVAVHSDALGALGRICRSGNGPGHELDTLSQKQKADIAASEPARTLYWGESAPTATGASESKVNLLVSRAEFRWVCVYASLTPRETRPTSELNITDRQAMAIIDLCNVAATPAAAAQ